MKESVGKMENTRGIRNDIHADFALAVSYCKRK